ncbi:MAG: PilZ domain-containing protein [Gammaproteobacteria bacterium]|nr:PilZ domain-containing protein [Gammaproteobacteria bacterium]
MSSQERRNNQRIPFQAEIIMQSGNEEWSCNLLDISLKGMLVEPPDNLDIDTSKPCALALFLGEDTAIHARVNITHVMGNGNWGLQWKHIDVDSLKHLRRLLELNTNDPDLMHRELADLG